MCRNRGVGSGTLGKCEHLPLPVKAYAPTLCHGLPRSCDPTMPTIPYSKHQSNTQPKVTALPGSDGRILACALSLWSQFQSQKFSLGNQFDHSATNKFSVSRNLYSIVWIPIYREASWQKSISQTSHRFVFREQHDRKRIFRSLPEHMGYIDGNPQIKRGSTG